MRCSRCGVLALSSSFIDPAVCEFCGIENDVASLYTSRFDPRLH